MGDVELDGSAAEGLKIDEGQPIRRPEQCVLGGRTATVNEHARMVAALEHDFEQWCGCPACGPAHGAHRRGGAAYGAAVGRRERWVYVALGALAVVASLTASRRGTAFDADSAAYLGTAQNIIEGRGVTVPFTLFTDSYSPRVAAGFHGRVPLTHFPPGYPLVVAAFAKTGLGVEQAARILGALLLGLNALLMGSLAARLVRGRAVRICVVLLAVVGPVTGDALPGVRDRTGLVQHGQAMSEGLFTCFVLLTLVALLRFRDRLDDRSLCLVAGATALALATRYVGVALVATSAVAVFAWTPGRNSRRAAVSGVLAVCAIAPTAVWVVVTSGLEQAETARSIHWSGQGSPDLPRVFEGWLGIAQLPAASRHVTLAAVLVITAVGAWRVRRQGHGVLVAVIGFYTATVIFTRFALDVSTPFDDRMFSPVQGTFYLLVLGAATTAFGDGARHGPIALRAARVATVGAPTAVLILALPYAAAVVGNGYTQPRRPLDVVRAASGLPANALIATNVPTQIWEATKRPSILVPLRVTTITGMRNEEFPDEVAELVTVTSEHNGYIVLVGAEAGSFGTSRQANETDFLRFRNVSMVRRFRDGVILRTQATHQDSSATHAQRRH